MHVITGCESLKLLPASAIFEIELCDPTAQSKLNEQNALRLASEFAQAVGHGNKFDFLQIMSELDFAESYDPVLPTIAFDVDSIDSTSLFAIAANRRLKVANIVYISSATKFGNFAVRPDGSAGLQVTDGVIVTPEGRFMAGHFPTSVKVDSLQTSDPTLYDQCEMYGVTPMMSRNSNDDKSIYSVDAIRPLMPRRLGAEEMWVEDESASYVIKPSNRYGGIGINIFSTINDADKADEYFTFLKEHGYEPIIEELLEGIPLIDPLSGETLDWYVKALINNGSVAGMYVRAFSSGNTINQAFESRYISLNELSQYIADADQASRIVDTIIRTAEQVSTHFDSGYRSADIFIDSDEQGRLFEVNSGNVAGLKEITSAENVISKFNTVNSIIVNWIGHIRATSDTYDGQYVEYHQPANGIVASFIAAALLERTVRISRVTLEDIGGNAAQPEAIGMWLMLQHFVADRRENRRRLLEIEEMHRQHFPLDIMQSLPQWMASSPDRRRYEQYIAKLAFFLPNYKPVRDAVQALNFYNSW